jgi:hypothetical protein
MSFRGEDELGELVALPGEITLLRDVRGSISPEPNPIVAGRLLINAAVSTNPIAARH